jgi:purine-nucleoside phosphorylase
MGRLHGYEGLDASAVAYPVMIPRLCGTKQFLLTNASGGLAANFRPGDVMIIRDHVNLTGKNPLVGPNPTDLEGTELGPRFPDLGDLYDAAWRMRLEKCCLGQGLNVHEGTYLGVLGPSFETPAEVRLFASWGLHAVGMSTVWEAIALRHSGATVAGLSLISNFGAGLSAEKLDHTTILNTSRAAASKIIAALDSAFAEALK